MVEGKISHEQYCQARRDAYKEVSKNVPAWLRKGVIKLYVTELEPDPPLANESMTSDVKCVEVTFGIWDVPAKNRLDKGFELEWIG